MKIRRSILLMLLAVAVLPASNAPATIYFQDGFNYPAGSAMYTNSPWSNAFLGNTNLGITVWTAGLIYGSGTSALQGFSPPGLAILETNYVSPGSWFIYDEFATNLNLRATNQVIYTAFLLEVLAPPGVTEVASGQNNANCSIMEMTTTNAVANRGVNGSDLELGGGTTAWDMMYDAANHYLGVEACASPSSGGRFSTNWSNAGLYWTNTTAWCSNNIIATNVTYFVVVKYMITNNSVALYINPMPGSTEPTPNLIQYSAGAAFTASYPLGTINLVTANGNNQRPPIVIDSLRIGSTWGDVTPAASSAITATLVLSSGSNPSTYGDALTYQATVSPAPPDGENVIFYNGANAIGTGTTASGVATLNISSLTAGTNSITAFYPGDAIYAASTSPPFTQMVNQAIPLVSSLPTASSINQGQTLASSFLSGGSATNSEGALVGGNFAFTALYTAPGVGTGSQSVTFTPTDMTNYTTTTASVVVTVNAWTGTVWKTLVDGTSFSSVNAFTNQWNCNYPWGTSHNGSALMNKTNITVSNNMVTLTSSLTNTPNEGVSEAPFYVPIHYNSGTFYLTQPITINQQHPIWDISGYLKVPTVLGTWPAFWITGVTNWPPESDIAEFKGTDMVDQETYDGAWQTVYATIPSAAGYTGWHNFRLVATLENSTNVDFHYFIDGVLEQEQTSATFVGSPCWFIIDYQMEGSSGTPGPSYTTYYYISNIVVSCENVSAAATGPITNGVYKALVQSTGDSLAPSNTVSAIGSPLGQWPYNAGLNEQWLLTCLGNNEYGLIGRQSGRALGVLGGSTTNGASADLEDYVENNNQKWQFVNSAPGYYELININSGRALEVSNNSPSIAAAIDQWSAANATQPQIKASVLLGTNFVLTGSAGVPGVGYSLFSSPSLTTPLSNWAPISTVMADGGGNLSFTNGMAYPQQFYLLKFQSANGASNQQWTFQSP